MTTRTRLPRRNSFRHSNREHSINRPIRHGAGNAVRKNLPRLEKKARRGWVDQTIEPLGIPPWKRGFDILLILLLLPVALMLALAICCWIKLVSPGNVLFRQNRIGRGGKDFTIYKFRTMKHKAETSIHEAHVEQLIKSNQPMTKLDYCGDTRLIKGGCMIRMTGLDELPQLVNVLLGEMSLVGPRPCVPCEFPLFDPEHHLRFAVLPGLTGLWQVRRTEGTTFREMVGMDVAYAGGCTPWLDFLILARTPAAVLRQLATYARSKIHRQSNFRAAAQPAGQGFAGLSHTR